MRINWYNEAVYPAATISRDYIGKAILCGLEATGVIQSDLVKMMGNTHYQHRRRHLKGGLM